MKFATVAGRLALVDQDVFLDVDQASGGRFSSEPLTALAQWEPLLDWARGADTSAGRPLVRADLGPPVPAPRQVFAVALNYRPHAAEAGFEAPDAPLVFTKFPSCIVGPDACVDLPAGKVDWEVELVVVIGSGGRDIARADAWAAVAGLTVGQDLSERVTQSAGKPAQFSLGKSYAGFGPTGPVLVTPDSVPDRDDLAFSCWLNGERMQYGRTSEMIFPVDDLIARLSAICALLPGDLIFTGTPAGVGNRMTPPRYLQPGDVLVSRFDDIGELRQTFA